MTKIIISDTSCLITLSNIDLLDVLKELYQEIIFTPEVKEEFGERIPEWIFVNKVQDKLKQAEIAKNLDLGEASSIALALEMENPLLIIDEIKGRKIAKNYNIEIVGTIGVILLAHKKGIIQDVIGTLLKLINKGFRISEKLLYDIINIYGRQ